MSENTEKCAEIYRIKADSYSFVCYHCGDTADTARQILIHIEHHFKVESSASPNSLNSVIDGFWDTIIDEPYSTHEPSIGNTLFTTEIATHIPEQLFADAITTDTTMALSADCEADHIEETVECKQCFRRYINEHTLEAHTRKVHITQQSTMIQSQKVQTRSKRKSRPDDAVQQIRCEECGFMVITTTALINHMVEVHSRCDFTDAPPLKCGVCPKLFIRKYRRNRHMWTDHPQRGEPFECNVCGAIFRNKGNLAAHSLKHDGANGECFTCATCKKSFKAQSSLTRHLWNHCNRDPNRKTYKCEMCAIQFNYKVSHVNHMRKHSGEQPYQCYMCGLSFRLAGKLTEHIKVKHPTKMFACPHCPKEFRSNYILNNHIETHSSERTFGCDQCSKLFKSKRTLRQHKLTHAESKQYKCSYCGLEFSQKAGLRGHERTKHLLASSTAVKAKRKIV